MTRRVWLALLVFSFGAALQAEPLVRETHQDWTVVCDTPENLDDEVCLIIQQQNLRGSDRPIIRVEIGYAFQTGKPFAVITAPLGVALAAGLSMQIDDAEPERFDYGSCIPKGCVVGTGLTDAQLDSLRRGKSAKFTFKDNRNRDISVPVSLNGLTAALRAIEQ